MADITKCLNERCPQRMECYRFTAMESDRQSFGWFKPEMKTGECEHYLTSHGKETTA